MERLWCSAQVWGTDLNPKQPRGSQKFEPFKCWCVREAGMSPSALGGTLSGLAGPCQPAKQGLDLQGGPGHLLRALRARGVGH